MERTTLSHTHTHYMVGGQESDPKVCIQDIAFQQS